MHQKKKKKNTRDKKTKENFQTPLKKEEEGESCHVSDNSDI